MNNFTQKISLADVFDESPLSKKDVFDESPSTKNKVIDLDELEPDEPGSSIGVLSPKERKRQLNQEKTKKHQQALHNSGSAIIKKMQSDLNNLASVVSSTNDPVIWSLLASNVGTTLNDSEQLALKSVNGIWDQLTQKSLQKALKLAAGLINTNSVFKLNVPGYTPEYFANLKQLISGYKFKSNGQIDLPLLGDYNQSWRANLISVHINALITFYNDVINSLKNNEKVDLSNKSVYKKEGPKTFDEKESKVINDYLNQFGEHDLPLNLNLDGKKVKITIPISSLKSMNDFKNWFTTSKYKQEIAPYGSAEQFFNQVVKPQLG